MLSQRFGLGLTHRFLTYCLSSLDISDVSRILADFFAAANEFQKFSGVYGGRIFFGGSGYSAAARKSSGHSGLSVKDLRFVHTRTVVMVMLIDVSAVAASAHWFSAIQRRAVD